MTLKQLLIMAINKVKKTNKEVEAVKLLLMELSGFTPPEFYMEYEKTISVEIANHFLKQLDLYINEDIPVQHLIGSSYFFGRKFIVNHEVLIPRRETEELVENVLFYYDKYFSNQHVKVIDIGTGSGCIAITLDLEEVNMKVQAIDISEAAINVANQNNTKLQSNVELIVSDLFSNVTGKFDIIVANPPYIPDNQVIGVTVDKEPSVALYGGVDGTKFYELIISDSCEFINERGLLAFEHGREQSEIIHLIASKYYPSANIIQLKDMQGENRFTLIGIGGILSEEG